MSVCIRACVLVANAGEERRLSGIVREVLRLKGHGAFRSSRDYKRYKGVSAVAYFDWSWPIVVMKVDSSLSGTIYITGVLVRILRARLRGSRSEIVVIVFDKFRAVRETASRL